MILPKRYVSKGPLRIGVLCFLALLALAGHFYLERVAYLDLALHVFAYLRDNRLFIQNQRFVAAATQVWPLLGIRTGWWSLDTIMRIYSLAIVGYYFFVFLVSGYLFKNEQVALVVPLLLTLLISRTFYWAQSEYPQAMAILLLYYAGVAKMRPLPADWRTLGLLLLIPVSIYGHPLLLISFLFLWAYDYLLNQRYKDWLYYLTLVVALGSYWLRMSKVVANSYEAQKMSLGSNLIRFFPNYLSLPSNKQLLQLCQTSYYMLPVLLLVITGYYLWQRPAGWPLRWLLLVGFSFGYSQVVTISYPDSADLTYLENLYLPLGLFVAVPFALEVLPAIPSHKLAGALLVGLFSVRLLTIWQAHTPYTEYIQSLKQLIAYTRQFPEHKFIIDRANVDPQHRKINSWAAAYESLLLSARYQPDSARQLYIPENELAADDLPTSPASLLTPWETIPYDDLPRTYVRLQPSSYRNLNTAPPADTASLATYIKHNRASTLKLQGFAAPLRTNQPTNLTVCITGVAGQILHSSLRVPHPTVLTYRYLTAGDWPLNTGTLNTPLEVDVVGSWTQDITLLGPPEPGRYVLEVLLTSQGYREWPVRVRIPVEVKL